MRKNESTPFWPKAMAAPEGAPNVLMILIDDSGFGATSAFGGPIPTPTFEGAYICVRTPAVGSNP